jgi:hypothetical protein
VPVVAYLLVYVFTCLLGALLMLERYRPFVALYEYFSGTQVPRLDHHDGLVAWLLLLVAPALLCVGYAIAMAIPGRYLGAALFRPVVRRARLDTPGLVPHVVFYILALLGVLSLRHAGSFSNLSSWFHYQSWIESRQRSFEVISFAGFVNLYLLVPAAAAWVLVTSRGRSWQSQVARWLPFVIALGLTLLLFQKKAAVVAAIIVLGSWIYSTAADRPRRASVVGIVAAAAVIVLYFAAIVTPVYSRSQKAVKQQPRAATNGTSHRTALPPAVAHLLAKRKTGIAVYALLAPLVRTSAPSLYYPVIYPGRHAFYGLDLGQDVLGIGAMPDDNLVVWRAMNPDLPGGAIAAPYQFPLYSQVGLGGALAMSAVFGALLALLWRAATAAAWPRPWASLLASIVLVLGIYLAIDSARNSALVSYGVLWAFGFVLGAAVFVHVVNLAIGNRRATKTVRGGTLA